MKVNQIKVNEYLKKLNAPKCPLCGNTYWEASDIVFQSLEFNYNGINLGGATFPFIPITCNKCGNTMIINALVANLIDPDNTNETNIK